MRRAESHTNISRNAAALASVSERNAMSKPDAAGSTGTTHAPAPARLLLAEDDFELRQLLCCVLRADGHEVVEACDGNELWQLLSRENAGEGPAPYALVV